MGQSTDELTRGIEHSRENLSRDVDELTDKISPSRIAHRQKEAATSRLRGVRDQIMGSAHEGTSQLSDAAQGAGDAATDAVHQLGAKAKGNPLGAGLVAFGAGLVLSALIPPSKAETEAAQRALDTAKEQGAPLLDHAKAVGQEAADHLKERAGEAVEEIRGTAEEGVEHVRAEATDAAGTVKDAAPGT